MTTSNRNRASGRLVPLLIRAGIFAVLCISAFLLITPVKVVDSGMEPLVREGDLCLAWKPAEPIVGDVVIYEDNSSTLRVGRVVATEDMDVAYGIDAIFIDGIAHARKNLSKTGATEHVAHGRFYIVADEPAETVDSTSEGSYPQERIRGNVFWLFRCRGFSGGSLI